MIYRPITTKITVPIISSAAVNHSHRPTLFTAETLLIML